MEYYTILSLALLPIILFLFLSRNLRHLPPGPRPWPVIGNVHQLGEKPHHSITELSKIYGPIMRLKLGSVTTIVISSPELAKEMFVNHDLALSGRNVPDGGRVANHDKYSVGWLPVGPKWRNLRKISTVLLFTNRRLDAAQEIRQKKVDELIDYVRSCCVRGEAVDIGKAALTTSINVLSCTLFSVNLAGHTDSSSSSLELQDLLLQFSEEGGKPNVSDVFPSIRFLDLQGLRDKVGSCFSKMLRIMGRLIDERLTDLTMDGKDDVLSNLLELVQDNELSLDDVKHLLVDLFIAGTKTTSTALEWAMTELLHNPEKMIKAQHEIDKVLAGKHGSVQESDISKLPYIQAVAKETLRLYPPAPFLLPHKAENDVQISGYTVPKNAQVWVNIWSIGRDPRVWLNPNSFEPERFLEGETNAKGRGFEFIPFGEGRRICPGMPLAYRMMHLMLANLLCSFRWEPSDGMNPEDVGMEDKFGITLQRVQPLRAVPLSR